MRIEQALGDAGVFGQDTVCVGKHIKGPQSDIAQIADRRSDQIKAGVKRLYLGRSPASFGLEFSG